MKRVGKYVLAGTLGEGASCKVKLGVDPDDGSTVAIKIVRKNPISHELPDVVIRELAVLSKLKDNGPQARLVNALDIYETPDHVYLIMEHVVNGELFERIEENVGLPLDYCHVYFMQLVSAVTQLHSLDICHLDIKPENLLLDHKGNLKLCDFGFAISSPVNGTYDGQQGSFPYVPPEVMAGEDPYDPRAADIWCCGMVLFVMCTGRMPWEMPCANKDPHFQRYLLTGKKYLGQLLAHHKDAALVSLLFGLLAVIPKSRPIAADIKRRSWFLRSNALLKKPDPKTNSSSTSTSASTSASTSTSTSTSGKSAGVHSNGVPVPTLLLQGIESAKEAYLWDFVKRCRCMESSNEYRELVEMTQNQPLSNYAGGVVPHRSTFEGNEHMRRDWHSQFSQMAGGRIPSSAPANNNNVSLLCASLFGGSENISSSSSQANRQNSNSQISASQKTAWFDPSQQVRQKTFKWIVERKTRFVSLLAPCQAMQKLEDIVISMNWPMTLDRIVSSCALDVSVVRSGREFSVRISCRVDEGQGQGQDGSSHTSSDTVVDFRRRRGDTLLLKHFFEEVKERAIAENLVKISANKESNKGKRGTCSTLPLSELADSNKRLMTVTDR
jgi:serine/threonine protein kinase